MVDALRRSHRMVRPDGLVVDLHPSAWPASVEVGNTTTGYVFSPDARDRHADAGVALATIIDERLLQIDEAATFTFYTYGDTIEELRDYIEENWRDSRLEAHTIERTREALRHAAGARPRTREEVHITRLRPRYD